MSVSFETIRPGDDKVSLPGRRASPPLLPCKHNSLIILNVGNLKHQARRGGD